MLLLASMFGFLHLSFCQAAVFGILAFSFGLSDWIIELEMFDLVLLLGICISMVYHLFSSSEIRVKLFSLLSGCLCFVLLGVLLQCSWDSISSLVKFQMKILTGASMKSLYNVHACFQPDFICI